MNTASSDIIFKYFPSLPDEQIIAFTRLEQLYASWNEKINVISRKDIDHLYEHHVLPSLSIAKFHEFSPGTKILDVGTGGGFPGIPLAILFPECHFTLTDLKHKKIKVVSDISSELGLKNVTAIQMNVDEYKAQFDFILSRAVTAFPEFVKMTDKNISRHHQNAIPNGIIYLTGGPVENDLEAFPEAMAFDLSNYFEEEYFSTKKLIYLPVDQ
jgi:16S rRNA (guanine527-N7)-methyltransferase